MGCDIHILTEFKNKDESSWSALHFQAINPGRNYDLFNVLSGVRGHNDNPIATSGWPKSVSYAAQNASGVRVNDENRAAAEGWVARGISKWLDFCTDMNGKPMYVSSPDWHSYGHCTIEQMSKALRKAGSSPEYRAMMAAARSLEKDGMDVRFLFFYDN